MSDGTNEPHGPRDALGRPLTDLRISVTDRCNFRCSYCMPREVYDESYRFLPRAEILSFEEIARLARLFVGQLGVRKLRITGGEPLVRRDLPDLIAMLTDNAPDVDIALTTNGHFLAERAAALAAAGLRRVTVSLDALDQPTFARLNGNTGDLARVLRAIEAAREAGLHPIKINCVVQRGVNEHAIRDLARFGRERGCTVRFIEFMDVGTLNAWAPESVVPADEILAQIAQVAPVRALDAGARREVAERFAYTDGQGEVGVIASITRPFCGDCSRARLSADGRLITCLFASDGLDLRAPLRAGEDDDQLIERLHRAWSARADRYSELRAQRASADGAPRRRLQMYVVGG